jgi:hypothetical protein
VKTDGFCFLREAPRPVARIVFGESGGRKNYNLQGEDERRSEKARLAKMDAASQHRRDQLVPGFSLDRDHLLVCATEPATVPVMQETGAALFLMGWTVSNLGYVCP